MTTHSLSGSRVFAAGRLAALISVVAGADAAQAAPVDHPMLAASACLRQGSSPTFIHHARFAYARFGARTQSVVRVNLGHDGLVRNVALIVSSGDRRFDAAALASARTSAFAPAAQRCVAVDSRFDEAFTATREGAVVATIGATPVAATALR